MGEASLRPAQVRMRSATGDDMGVIGSTSVRGWCDDKLVDMTALVATRATRSLCSASKLLSFGNEVEMKPTHSALRHRNGGTVLLRRSGNRDFLVIRVAKTSEVNTITTSTMKREVESLKSELARATNGSEVTLSWTLEEKHRHEINGHAEYDNRCEICVKSGHPRRVYSESCAFSHAGVTFKDAYEFVMVLTGSGPRCDCFTRVVPHIRVCK